MPQEIARFLAFSSKIHYICKRFRIYSNYRIYCIYSIYSYYIIYRTKEN